MASLSTIRTLRAWAQWGTGAHFGYPSASPMFGERALKTPLYGVGYCPLDVWDCEQAVCNLPFDARDCLIQRYQRHATWVTMGQRFGINWRSARRRTQAAEEAVHCELACVVVGQRP